MTIDLTASAVTRLKEIYADDTSKLLRVAVDSGGCHGLTYSFQLTPQVIDNEDVVFTEGESGTRVVVDVQSLPYISGSEVDYERTFMRRAFTLKHNPQAGSECGCGTSFDIKR